MTDDDIFRAGPIHIVGAGDFGREVLDALFASGREPGDLVLLDDHVGASEIHGVPVCRPDDVAGGRYVIAVADPAARERLHQRMRGNGGRPTTVIHPLATLAHDVEPENGVIVLAGALVSASVRLGAHCQVHDNASIGTGSVLHEFTTLLPGANVAAGVTLQRSVTIGGNTSVPSGPRLNEGTVVTSDQVKGAPAR
ncbi:hypothetical protein BAY61_16330 [Prauserella marina]|uniref:Uncharacterized protein n=1 Tax=Prauserella marina TaxID=530584 RepID=A0A222VQV8_9PSEU|nr:hypothetical protein [Prauserella marina]ASR36315.1 hypothetical protein BAY61_16330 [Prauserella marina]PWV77096.1 hypothetical protein DES30_105313 [Prauserella marina]SDD04320.1 hypothetical protein SAMN05421630_105314 [Prauserella marina]